ncbi:MAG TPA: hypothetical protein VJR70_04735 [Stellaceae bacterium]|nr:hypothetical protein [Stellaceae bacterium]
MKALMSGAAALALATFAFAVPASAQCWWNGYSCAPAAAYGAPYWAPYGYSGYADYYGGGYPYYGYKPAWLPSIPGPRPSGRAGQ